MLTPIHIQTIQGKCSFRGYTTWKWIRFRVRYIRTQTWQYGCWDVFWKMFIIRTISHCYRNSYWSRWKWMIPKLISPMWKPAWSPARAHNEKKEMVPFWDTPYLPAIGALCSNTSDLVKYIYANNAKVTPAISLSHQLSFGTKEEGMALNWFIRTSANGYRVLEHDGGTGGSRSSFQCFPQINSGFVLLTNSLANRNQLEKELASIVTGQTK